MLFQESDAKRIESILVDAATSAETIDRSWRAENDDSPVSWTALAITNPRGVMEFVVVTGVEDDAAAVPPLPVPSHRHLLGNSPFEMWAFDRGTYRFLAVNEATAREHGYSEEELRAMRVLDLWPWEEAPRLLEVITEMASGQNTRRRAWHRRKDGTVFEVESEAVVTEAAGRPVCLVLSQPAEGP